MLHRGKRHNNSGESFIQAGYLLYPPSPLLRACQRVTYSCYYRGLSFGKNWHICYLIGIHISRLSHHSYHKRSPGRLLPFLPYTPGLARVAITRFLGLWKLTIHRFKKKWWSKLTWSSRISCFSRSIELFYFPKGHRFGACCVITFCYGIRGLM